MKSRKRCSLNCIHSTVGNDWCPYREQPNPSIVEKTRCESVVLLQKKKSNVSEAREKSEAQHEQFRIGKITSLTSPFTAGLDSFIILSHFLILEMHGYREEVLFPLPLLLLLLFLLLHFLSLLLLIILKDKSLVPSKTKKANLSKTAIKSVEFEVECLIFISLLKL